jgi:hypothetical protein
MSELKGRNLGWTVVGKLCVTTGMLPTFIQAFGGEVETFETLIWAYDTELDKPDKRGKILHQLHHGSEAKAIKSHAKLVEELTKGIAVKLCPDCFSATEEKDYEDIHNADMVSNTVDMCYICGVVVYDTLDFD